VTFLPIKNLLTDEVCQESRHDPFALVYYYGLRYFVPGPGRWLNRDPLGETGGVNLYCFIGDDPNTNYDSFRLEQECTEDTCHSFAVKWGGGGYVGFGASGYISASGEKCNCCPCGTQSVDVGVFFEAQVGTGIGGEFGPIKLELKGPQLGITKELHYLKECNKDHGEIHWDYKISGTFGYEPSVEIGGVGVSGSVSIEYNIEAGLEVDSSGARGYYSYGYDVSEDYTISGGILESGTTKHIKKHDGGDVFGSVSW
jgi:RHS repeat-associated protein